MANKKPTQTNDQQLTPVPSEAEVREMFQRAYYVTPGSDGEGNPTNPRLDTLGPAYPTWAQKRDANRGIGPVRTATKAELLQYNMIIGAFGEQAAKDWLTEAWRDD